MEKNPAYLFPSLDKIEDIDSWMHKLTKFVVTQEWDAEGFKLFKKFIGLYFQGPFEPWFQEKKAQIKDLDSLRTLLYGDFLGKNFNSFFYEFISRKQLEGEPFSTYSRGMQKLARNIPDLDEKIILFYIAFNSKPLVKKHVFPTKFNDVAALVSAATGLEEKSRFHQTDNIPQSTFTISNENDVIAENNDSINYLNGKQNKNYGDKKKNVHPNSNSNAYPNGNSNAYPNSNSNGHYNQKPNYHSKPRGNWKSNNGKQSIRCFNCGGFGHTLTNCSTSPRNSNNSNYLTFDSKKDDILKTDLKVCGIKFESIIDTGSNISLVNTDLVNQIEVDIISCDKSVQTASGKLNLLGECNLNVDIDGKSFEHKFYVASFPFSVLVGTDLMKKTNLLIDFSSNSIISKTDKLACLINDEKDKIDISKVKIGIVSEKNKINDILNFYKNVFSEKPGEAHLFEFAVKLKNDEPLICRPYKTSPVANEKIRLHVEDMLKKGVIKKLESSQWMAPVALVPKGDQVENGGTLLNDRFVIDYSKINERIVDFGYPPKDMDVILNSIGNKKVFTTMDVTTGYWNVKVKPEDIEKLAFVTVDGVYGPVRMPFGVKTAPAFFQALMDKILEPLIKKGIVKVFIDDICICSDSIEQHYQHLKEVFEILKDSGLAIKLKKCKFFMQEVKFLGLIIGNGGIKPDKSKLLPISNALEPKDIKELQSFLGMVNFYNKFVPNLAYLAAPLYDLLQKDENGKLKNKFQFNDNYRDSFNKLKEALTKDSLFIHFPNFKKTFYYIV